MTVEDRNETGDPNILAFKEALERGDFEDLAPDTYVIFHEEKFVLSCSAAELEKVKKDLLEEGKSGFLYTQPNMPRKRRFRNRSPRKH